MALGDRQDEELVASLADGDLAALRELYRRHAPWMKARLTRNRRASWRCEPSPSS